MEISGNRGSNQRVSSEIHVLLVDDDEEYAAMASRLLEHQNSSMSVTTAGSALAALVTLASGSAAGTPMSTRSSPTTRCPGWTG